MARGALILPVGLAVGVTGDNCASFDHLAGSVHWWVFSQIFNLSQLHHIRKLFSFFCHFSNPRKGNKTIVISWSVGRHGLVGLFVMFKSHGAKGRRIEYRSFFFYLVLFPTRKKRRSRKEETYLLDM